MICYVVYVHTSLQVSTVVKDCTDWVKHFALPWRWLAWYFCIVLAVYVCYHILWQLVNEPFVCNFVDVVSDFNLLFQVPEYKQGHTFVRIAACSNIHDLLWPDMPVTADRWLQSDPTGSI